MDLKVAKKKVRGTYKVVQSKTPQENINEVLKLVMPIRLTLNKLQTGKDSTCAEDFKIDGVQITAIGRYKYATTQDIDDFKKIHFYMRKAGNNWGRENQRSWSVPVKNGKISLTHISNVFNKLSSLHKEAKIEHDARIEKDKRMNEDLQKLREKSKLPSFVSLNVRSVEPYLPTDQKTRDDYYYSIWFSLNGLTPQQVTKMGQLFTEIDNIANELRAPKIQTMP